MGKDNTEQLIRQSRELADYFGLGAREARLFKEAELSLENVFQLPFMQEIEDPEEQKRYFAELVSGLASRQETEVTDEQAEALDDQGLFFNEVLILALMQGVSFDTYMNRIVGKEIYSPAPGITTAATEQEQQEAVLAEINEELRSKAKNPLERLMAETMIEMKEASFVVGGRDRMEACAAKYATLKAIQSYIGLGQGEDTESDAEKTAKLNGLLANLDKYTEELAHSDSFRYLIKTVDTAKLAEMSRGTSAEALHNFCETVYEYEKDHSVRTDHLTAMDRIITYSDWSKANEAYFPEYFITNGKLLKSIPNPFNITITRSGLASLAFSKMIENGFDVEDVLDPDRLKETKKAVGSDVFEKCQHEENREEVVRTYLTGLRKIVDYANNQLMRLKSLNPADIAALDEPSFLAVGTYMKDINQELGRMRSSVPFSPENEAEYQKYLAGSDALNKIYSAADNLCHSLVEMESDKPSPDSVNIALRSMIHNAYYSKAFVRAKEKAQENDRNLADFLVAEEEEHPDELFKNTIGMYAMGYSLSVDFFTKEISNHVKNNLRNSSQLRHQLSKDAFSGELERKLHITEQANGDQEIDTDYFDKFDIELSPELRDFVIINSPKSAKAGKEPELSAAERLDYDKFSAALKDHNDAYDAVMSTSTANTDVRENLFGGWLRKNSMDVRQLDASWPTAHRFSVSRDAAASLITGLLLAEGLTLEEVYDPEKGIDVKDRVSIEVIDKLYARDPRTGEWTQDLAWTAKKMHMAGRAMVKTFSEKLMSADCSGTDSLCVPENKELFGLSAAMGDLCQEISKKTFRNGSREFLLEDWLEDDFNEINHGLRCGSFFGPDNIRGFSRFDAAEDRGDFTPKFLKYMCTEMKLRRTSQELNNLSEGSSPIDVFSPERASEATDRMNYLVSVLNGDETAFQQALIKDPGLIKVFTKAIASGQLAKYLTEDKKDISYHGTTTHDLHVTLQGIDVLKQPEKAEELFYMDDLGVTYEDADKISETLGVNILADRTAAGDAVTLYKAGFTDESIEAMAKRSGITAGECRTMILQDPLIHGLQDRIHRQIEASASLPEAGGEKQAAEADAEKIQHAEQNVLTDVYHRMEASGKNCVEKISQGEVPTEAETREFMTLYETCSYISKEMNSSADQESLSSIIRDLDKPGAMDDLQKMIAESDKVRNATPLRMAEILGAIDFGAGISQFKETKQAGEPDPIGDAIKRTYGIGPATEEEQKKQQEANKAYDKTISKSLSPAKAGEMLRELNRRSALENDEETAQRIFDQYRLVKDYMVRDDLKPRQCGITEEEFEFALSEMAKRDPEAAKIPTPEERIVERINIAYSSLGKEPITVDQYRALFTADTPEAKEYAENRELGELFRSKAAIDTYDIPNRNPFIRSFKMYLRTGNTAEDKEFNDRFVEKILTKSGQIELFTETMQEIAKKDTDFFYPKSEKEFRDFYKDNMGFCQTLFTLNSAYDSLRSSGVRMAPEVEKFYQRIKPSCESFANYCSAVFMKSSPYYLAFPEVFDKDQSIVTVTMISTSLEQGGPNGPEKAELQQFGQNGFGVVNLLENDMSRKLTELQEEGKFEIPQDIRNYQGVADGKEVSSDKTIEELANGTKRTGFRRLSDREIEDLDAQLEKPFVTQKEYDYLAFRQTIVNKPGVSDQTLDKAAMVGRIDKTFGPKFQFDEAIKEAKVYTENTFRQEDYALPDQCPFTEHQAAVIGLAIFSTREVAGENHSQDYESAELRADVTTSMLSENLVAGQFRMNFADPLTKEFAKARSMTSGVIKDFMDGRKSELARILGSAIKCCVHSINSAVDISSGTVSDALIASECLEILKSDSNLLATAKKNSYITDDIIESINTGKAVADLYTEFRDKGKAYMDTVVAGGQPAEEETHEIVTLEQTLRHITNHLAAADNENKEAETYKFRLETANQRIKAAKNNDEAMNATRAYTELSANLTRNQKLDDFCLNLGKDGAITELKKSIASLDGTREMAKQNPRKLLNELHLNTADGKFTKDGIHTNTVAGMESVDDRFLLNYGMRPQTMVTLKTLRTSSQQLESYANDLTAAQEGVRNGSKIYNDVESKAYKLFDTERKLARGEYTLNKGNLEKLKAFYDETIEACNGYMRRQKDRKTLNSPADSKTGKRIKAVNSLMSFCMVTRCRYQDALNRMNNSEAQQQRQNECIGTMKPEELGTLIKNLNARAEQTKDAEQLGKIGTTMLKVGKQARDKGFKPEESGLKADDLRKAAVLIRKIGDQSEADRLEKTVQERIEKKQPALQ